MTPDRWRQVNEIFLAVAGAAPAERETHLARLAAGDPELRMEVERLLRGDARAADEGFLQASPVLPLRAAALDAATATSGHALRRSEPSDGPIEIPDFDLVRRLDRGGFGDVWLGRSRSGVFRAVKVLPRTLLSDVEIAGLRTFETFAGRHPHLIDVRHVGETPAWLYYVMELADGYSTAPTFDPDDYVPRTLKSDLRRRGALPPAEALSVARQVLAGLGHLHAAGLLHRDIKPANIVFVAGVAKLADIGLLAPDDAQRRAGLTPDYAPPGGVIDRSGDLFSVGRLLAEMLTGELPPIGQSWPAASYTERAAAAAPFVDLLAKACAAEPAARFQSAEEFDRALASAAGLPARPDDSGAGREDAADLRRRRVRSLMHWRNAVVGGLLLTFIATAVFHRPPVTRGDVLMTVVPHGKSTDAEIAVEKEFPLKPGDQVRFRVTLERPGYPILAIIAPDGTPDVVYPVSGPRQRAVTAVDVPADGSLWPLPDASGCVLVVLLVSARPVEDLSEIASRLRNLPAPDISAEWMVRATDDRPMTIKTLKSDRIRGAFDQTYTRRARDGAIQQIRTRFKERFPFICILAVPQIRG